MKSFNIYSVIVLVIVAGIVISTYLYLAPFYKTGYVWIDAALMVVGVIARMISRTPQIEVDSTSTQYYARTQAIGSAGLTLLILAVLHTILAITLPYNTTLPYLLLIGVAIIWYGFRIVTIHVGATIQALNDQKAAVQNEAKKNFSDMIKVPAQRLREELLTLETDDAIAQQDAINAIKNVELAVKGFSATNQTGIGNLTDSLTSWATSLEIAAKRIDSLSQEGEKSAFLKEITVSARQMLTKIKSV